METITNKEIKEYYINIIRLRKIEVQLINFAQTTHELKENTSSHIYEIFKTFDLMVNENLNEISKILGYKCVAKNYTVYAQIGTSKYKVRYDD